MALDRVFCTPTVTVDQDKYDELVRIKTLYKERIDKNMKVINTIFAEETPEGDAALFYLAKSIDAMSKVDAVIFMKGWENARGCKIEHEIAVRYNKFIKEL